MVTDRLTKRMGSVPKLPVKQSVSIDTMLNFEGGGHGHGNGDGTCKRALKPYSHRTSASVSALTLSLMLGMDPIPILKRQRWRPVWTGSDLMGIWCPNLVHYRKSLLTALTNALQKTQTGSLCPFFFEHFLYVILHNNQYIMVHLH